MTNEELQEVVAAVIAALKTNGRTITQLTEVTSVSDSDYFEMHGGRKIAYEHLYDNLLSETQGIIDTYTTSVNTYIASVRAELLGDIADKPDYYDASWLSVGEEVSGSTYADLLEAVNSHDLILVDGLPAIYAKVLQVGSGTAIRVWILKGKELIWYTATPSGTGATIEDASTELLEGSELEPIEGALESLKEEYLTQDEYNALVDAGTIDEDTKYFIYEE